MKDSNILINGLTPSIKISRNLRNVTHSKIVETNILKLSYIPYEISKILTINISISVKVLKKTKLPKGCTVNIIGFKNIDINYVSNDLNKESHKLHYKIPFSTELSYDYAEVIVKNIYVPVDKFSLKIIDPRQLIVSTRAYIAPLV